MPADQAGVKRSMSEGCNGNCEGCAGGCPSASEIPQDKLHELSTVRKVIGIVSGKGGVGKSLVTAMLAVLMNRRGYHVGILDADVTGPSIPKMFGLKTLTETSDLGIFPERTAGDIRVISSNLMLSDAEAPLVWRGPVISGLVKQFWTDVIWHDVDYLFIDMPPGTGDVPLTVFQSIPVDGVIIVTSPQDLVSMIVKKAYNMAQMMQIPVLGLVENMSYVRCPDCGKEIRLFGAGRAEETAAAVGLPLLGKVPIDPALAKLADEGEFERMTSGALDFAAEAIERELPVEREGNA